MSVLNPYLNFDGNTEEAFNFYRSVFGGDFQTVMRFKEHMDCSEWEEADRDKVMHIALPIGGNGDMLMGSDNIRSMNPNFTVGNNYSIALSPATREEADRLFAGLSDGGNVTMPMTDMFWGGYFGSFTDKFGVQWLINQDNGQQQ